MTFNLSLFFIFQEIKFPVAFKTGSALYLEKLQGIQAKANRMILNQHLSSTVSAVNTKKRLPDYLKGIYFYTTNTV